MVQIEICSPIPALADAAGGGRGGTRALLDAIVFNFMQFLGEIGPNISLMSPSGVGAYIWEIPDPPLLSAPQRFLFKCLKLNVLAVVRN